MNNKPFDVMKKISLTLLFCSAFSVSSYSQDAAPTVAPTPSGQDAVQDIPLTVDGLQATVTRLAPTIVERGPHHRVLETTTLMTDSNGLVTTNTGSYTELATGLHYLEDGLWKDSVAAFDLIPEGAIARRGQHQV